MEPIKLIDVPGHPRLRSLVFEHLPLSSQVLFLVDGTAIAQNPGPTVELLYDILCHPSLHGLKRFPKRSQGTRIKIIVNKADDGVKFIGAHRAQAFLEKEMCVS
jgi:signal recognition particle receptor subunit beta